MSQMDWAQARNVLCVRLDYLGDVLMCTPAMRAIKQSGSDRRVTLLSSGSGAAATSYIPEIDAAMEYAAPWMKNSKAHHPDIDLALVETLQSRHFDAAVIFTSYSQSALPAALLCYLAGIPLRLAHCRENPYRMLTDWLPDPEPHTLIRHEVRRQLDLVASAGYRTADYRLSFAVRDPDLAWMRRRLKNLAGMDVRKPWILLHPGASAASRRYPAELWSQVARRLAGLGFGVVLSGDAGEIAMTEEIRAAAGSAVCSLAGQLDLGKLGAAIALASAVISNNSGPAHMAAAIGTPLVDLYALTNPQHTPWHVKSRVLFHDVPCRFCYKSICPQEHHDCLAKIEPARVVEAVLSLRQ